MAKPNDVAISPTRKENYPEWYQQVVKAADLAENSSVRGCMVIKPWGYALWEEMQRQLDMMFKETGHMNAYFPLFIPLSYLAKEAEHVQGFAKECAVVTHHRLVPDLVNGGLKPDGLLDEPLVVRPTSETIIGESFAKWVQSYRDLPLLINQWANVVRWEMRTRLFLRTTEFLWQEGHTVHATPEDAMEETFRMLDVYETFARDFLAMPVIKGEKTKSERFPGAVNTFSIEAMMQDYKALQSGTSHFLGQNFARASNIKFLNRHEKEEIAWTTSWGVSTRMIGGLIMTHSDDNGFVLPPRIAAKQVVIMPIYKSDEEKVKVLEYCNNLKTELMAQRFADEKIRVDIDLRETGGGKAWHHIKRGVPVRVEIGPRDMAKDSVFVGRRDHEPKDKRTYERASFVKEIPTILQEIQKAYLDRATKMRNEKTISISSEKALRELFAENSDGGFAVVHIDDTPQIEALYKELKISARCMPLAPEYCEAGKCIITGAPVTRKTIVARAY